MECHICYTDTSEAFYTTSCNHNFHVSCIRTWYQHSVTCPCCRCEDVYRNNILNSPDQSINPDIIHDNENNENSETLTVYARDLNIIRLKKMNARANMYFSS